MHPRILLVLAALCAALPAVAQSPTPGARRPALRPVPVSAGFTGAVEAGTRTETGRPGPRYWQARVRYDIRAELDPASARLTANERIVWHNASPDTVRIMVLNLYQNLFTREFTGPNTQMNTGGVTLTRLTYNGTAMGPLTQQQFEANQRESRPSVGYLTTGTLSRLMLPAPIAVGDSAVFEVDWNYRVPPSTAPRTGFEDALGGRVFQIAQWYPQIAVYDDIDGFDVTRYTGQGEFYLEYGDFDVALTLPAGWTVGATGTLTNADQILRPEVRQRLAAVSNADSTVHVLPRGEIGGNGATTAGENGRVTWRFSARDVRDFAWATSNRYQWDALRAQIAIGKAAGALALGVSSRVVGTMATERPTFAELEGHVKGKK